MNRLRIFALLLLVFQPAQSVFAQTTWSKAAVCGMTTQGNGSFLTLGTPPTNALEEALAHPRIYKSVNVAIEWSQIQPNGPSDFNIAPIEAALANIQQYNLTYPQTPITATLQIFAGVVAPTWVKNLGGAPLTFTDNIRVGGGNTVPQTFTIGRFWSPLYVQAWRALQNSLAQQYDSDPRIQQVQVTSCSSFTAEPFVLHDAYNTAYTQQILAADPNFNTNYYNCLLGAATTDYASWQQTPLDYPFGSFITINNDFSITEDGDTGNAIMAVWKQMMGTRGLLGNHGLQGPAGVFLGAQGGFNVQKAVVYTGQTTGTLQAPFTGQPVNGIAYYGGPIEFQFGGPTQSAPAMVAGLDAAVQAGFSYGMTNFQMWDTQESGIASGSPVSAPQLETWASEFTCTPATLAPCGSTPSSGTGAQTLSQTTSTTAATLLQCPYGGTVQSVTTIAQPFLCINGSRYNQGSTTATVTLSAPQCNAGASCGTTPNGSLQSTIVSQHTDTAPAGPSVCSFGGTLTETTTVTQSYICTNGNLIAQGAPVTSVHIDQTHCTTLFKGAPITNSQIGGFASPQPQTQTNGFAGHSYRSSTAAAGPQRLFSGEIIEASPTAPLSTPARLAPASSIPSQPQGNVTDSDQGSADAREILELPADQSEPTLMPDGTYQYHIDRFKAK